MITPYTGGIMGFKQLTGHMQLIGPIDDMKAFDREDAQLNLANGTPRFYIMRLPAKPQGLAFTQITHHKQVTQCLGALTPPRDWYALISAMRSCSC
jgi:hypothetical protein